MLLSPVIVRFLLPVLVLGLGFAVSAVGQSAAPAVPIQPLRDVRAGQRGIGRTVFTGTKVEPFDVEILGVLEGIGPRQNIILARLSGGPIERTGVMQGMSGSPVWIEGRLVGAVALAFPFSKEPIAGIRPIEEMFAQPVPSPALARELPPRTPWPVGGARLEEVSTPVSFSGFSARTVEHFAADWRKLGLEPLQGVGGRSAQPAATTPPALEPGSMISVQLMTGDMAVGADGTVTHVDGNRLWGFGHRFLSAGTIDLPFARSEVIALLPNLSSSFKISASREWLGSITSDGNAAITGILGRRPPMTPLDILVEGSAVQRRYRMEMVQHPALTPFLLQMALFSAIDSTERAIGPATISIQGEVELEGLPPLRVQQTVASDLNAPVLASLSTASPLVYLLQTAADPLRVRAATFRIRVAEDRSQWQIEQLTSSRREARPGDELQLAVTLAGPLGQVRLERVRYQVPAGLAPGTLQITATDAMSANLAANRTLLLSAAKPASQLIRELNELRTAAAAYVRISRLDPVQSAGGVEYRNPPAGMALLLARQAATGLTAISGAAVAEIPIPLGAAVVSGSRTIQVEIR